MRKWTINLLLVVGASILTLVVLELVLRAFHPPQGTWRLHRIPHRELGWVLEPGVEFSRRVPWGYVNVRYNSEGFRDSRHAELPPENAIRIVVLGDSFMEANMVPLQHVIHKQFERLAASSGTQIVTYNLGVAGYGTLQEYMTFKNVGVMRKPDLVLLAFYLHNDVRNNAEHLNVGAMSRRAGKRKRPYLDESNDAEWTILKPNYEAIRAKYLRQKNSWSSLVKYNSVLLSLIRNARRMLKLRSEPYHGSGNLSMHECGSPQKYKKGWHTTERIIKRLKQDVQAAGARLVVFSVPAIFDADMRYVAELEKAEKSKTQYCVKESPGYRRLRMMLEHDEILYIDLVPEFRKAVTKEGQSLFVKGDWHWNKDGHALAAKTIYRRLVSEGYLPK
jgi:hypothetical protein